MGHVILINILIVASLMGQDAFATAIDGGAGSRGFKFLQIPPDAETASLGGASAAGRALSAASANPASLAETNSFAMTATHTEWLGAIRHEYLALAWPQFGGAVRIAVRMQSSGDIPLRSLDSGGSLVGIPSPEPQGVYGVHDAAFSVGYARNTGAFHWGVGISYVAEKIYLSSVSAILLDLGAQWRRGNWSSGIFLRNLGRSGKLRAERVPVPWEVQTGIQYGRLVRGIALRVLADVRYAPDSFETLSAGTEAELPHGLILRGGYRTPFRRGTDAAALSVGAAVRRGPIRLDYAYIPDRSGLGSTHALTAAFVR